MVASLLNTQVIAFVLTSTFHSNHSVFPFLVKSGGGGDHSFYRNTQSLHQYSLTINVGHYYHFVQFYLIVKYQFEFFFFQKCVLVAASKDFPGVITRGNVSGFRCFSFHLITFHLGVCVVAHTHPLVAVPGIALCFDAL